MNYDQVCSILSKSFISDIKILQKCNEALQPQWRPSGCLPLTRSLVVKQKQTHLNFLLYSPFCPKVEYPNKENKCLFFLLYLTAAPLQTKTTLSFPSFSLLRSLPANLSFLFFLVSILQQNSQPFTQKG